MIKEIGEIEEKQDLKVIKEIKELKVNKVKVLKILLPLPLPLRQQFYLLGEITEIICIYQKKQ